MECVHREGAGADHVTFHRAGVHGQLTVTERQFVVEARLGLLLGAFRHRIHTEIAHNLDRLLAHEEPLAAFEDALASRIGRTAGAAAGRRE